MRAVWFEGRNLTFKWNYVFLVGYYYPEQVGGSSVYQMDTTALLSVGAPGPILIEDNYINVWWNGFFLGGGDTAHSILRHSEMRLRHRPSSPTLREFKRASSFGSALKE
jgi:hypothetical protein